MKKIVFSLVIFCSAFIISALLYAQTDPDFDSAIDFYAQGKFEEVVDILTEYVERKPEPSAYWLIGYSLYKLGRHKESDDYFKEAYLIDPNFSPKQIEAFAPGLEKLEEKMKRELLEFGRPGTIPEERREFAPPQQPFQEAPVGTPETPTGFIEKKEGTLTVPQPYQPVEEKKPQQPTVAPPPLKAETPKPQPTVPSQPPKAPESRPTEPRKPITPQITPQKPVPPQKRGTPQPPTPPTAPQQIPGADTLTGKWMMLYGMMAGFGLIALIIPFALYIFYSLCLFLIAKKLSVPASWTAWIPILQVWPYVGAAGKSWAWILILFSPILGSIISLFSVTIGGIVSLVTVIVVFIISIYLWLCIADNLGKNKWLGLLILVPVVNFVFLGYLAFSKVEKSEVAELEALI